MSELKRQSGAMLAVIIPTINAARTLPILLAELDDVRVVVSDAGSTDTTLSLAVNKGAIIASGTRSRGAQLARGADLASADDAVTAYLFLHADCQLLPGWRDVVTNALTQKTGVWFFKYCPNVSGLAGVWLRFIVGLRCWAWRLPYGDQGLLMSREMYETLGGYDREKPLFEDVDIVDRAKAKFGRTALNPLPMGLRTDVSAHVREGVWKRGTRNFRLLRAYRRGVSIDELVRRYG